MRKNALVLVAIVSVLFTLGGCAQLPQAEVDAAKAALEAARAAEADRYVPQVFQDAESALASAMAEVQAQQDKFALFRSFDQATQLLATAKQKADQAVTEGKAAKEQARLDAEALITQAQTALDAAVEALKTAPRGKGTQAELEAMKTELDTAASTLAEARQTFDGGDYLGAKAKAEGVMTKAQEISADIDQAKQKRGR